MKGRLPEGVDFAAYPGRSSTPLPTAESKGAERINQLKIWNEAATSDDKRRLHAAQGKTALASAGSGSRRTDSFKDAKERHSASFQSSSGPDGGGGGGGGGGSSSNNNNNNAGVDADADDPNYTPPDAAAMGGPGGSGAGAPKVDMFADRSDSDSDDGRLGGNAHHEDDMNVPAQRTAAENQKLTPPAAVQTTAAAPRGPSDPERVTPAPAKAKATTADAPGTAATTAPPPKEAKGGCCVLQ
jgi:hypothetical protein